MAQLQHTEEDPLAPVETPPPPHKLPWPCLRPPVDQVLQPSAGIGEDSSIPQADQTVLVIRKTRRRTDRTVLEIRKTRRRTDLTVLVIRKTRRTTNQTVLWLEKQEEQQTRLSLWSEKTRRRKNQTVLMIRKTRRRTDQTVLVIRKTRRKKSTEPTKPKVPTSTSPTTQTRCWTSAKQIPAKLQLKSLTVITHCNWVHRCHPCSHRRSRTANDRGCSAHCHTWSTLDHRSWSLHITVTSFIAVHNAGVSDVALVYTTIWRKASLVHTQHRDRFRGDMNSNVLTQGGLNRKTVSHQGFPIAALTCKIWTWKGEYVLLIPAAAPPPPPPPTAQPNHPKPSLTHTTGNSEHEKNTQKNNNMTFIIFSLT